MEAYRPTGNGYCRVPRTVRHSCFLFPTGAGEPRQLTNDQIDHSFADWLLDGKHIVFSGLEPGHPGRLYVQDLEGGLPKAISPEGFQIVGLISPDGKYAVTVCPDFKVCLFPLAGGEPRGIPGMESVDAPIQWSADGSSLYMYRFGTLPATVERVDISTGKRTPWKTLAPADLAGVHGISQVVMTRDARVCLYSYLRTFSDLYLAQGIE